MGNIVVTKSRGMNLRAKSALVTLCTLLISAFIYEPALALKPIMHNSSTMTSEGNESKYGSWGLDKDCTWCHTKEDTNNVKLVKQTIETLNGPRNVIFTRMTASTNAQSGVLGNDARTYAGNGTGGSANICEVCHRRTVTLFHQYSAKASGHYDNQLCVGCHSHAEGFKPNGHAVPLYAVQGIGHDATGTMVCSSCHANTGAVLTYPTTGSAPDCRACHTKDDPTVAFNGCGSCHGVQSGNGEPTGTVHPDAAGSHAAHTIIGGVTCTTCHNPGGTGGNADHGKGNRGANAALTNLTTSFGWNSGAGTCATAYCHANPYGTNTTTTPAWGTDANCGACHKDGGAFQVNGAPATGSHDIHMAIAESACNQCHDGAASGASGGANHDDGDIDVTNGYPATAKHAAGTYADTAKCSTASCHANVYGPGTSPTPIWGTAANCGACHSGDPGAFQGNGAPATGSHAKHLNAPVSATCSQCHDGAVSGSDGGTSHRNNTIDVTNDYTGSPVTKHTAGTYTGLCQNAACHASPYAAVALASPVWGAEVGCVACHKDGGAFQNSTGHPRTGSHSKHMALNSAACNQCHAGAVKGTNPGTHHLNTFINVTGGYPQPVSKHPIGTYNGTCANSCHTNGNGTQLSSPKWGVAMPANCSGCHGGASNVTPLSAILATGKHRSHMNNISTLGKGNNFKCAECHAKTVSLTSNTLITNSANHINSLKDYSGAKAGGSSKYNAETKVCSNVYCHSTGQEILVYKNMTGSKTWTDTAKFDCNGCHGSYPGQASYFGAPNYPNKYQGTLATANSHERHTVVAGDTDSTACAKCHVTSVDASVPNKLRNYSTTHLNMVRDVAYRYTFAGYSEIYHVNEKTCATYCHSNVQTPGVAGGPATYYSKPAWGDNNTMTCASCHRDISTLAENPTDLNFGSHRRHVAFTNLTSGNAGAGYACSVCHGAAYSATGADTPTHANGAINLPFTGKGLGTTYSQGATSAPGNGYGTCSTSKCHGRAVKNWGISTTVHVCEKCHGSANTAINQGIFKDTGGSPTGNYAGTHVSHLAGTHNLMAPIQCSECHVVPANLDSFDHMSSMPAKLTWGPLSTRDSIIRGYTSHVIIPMVPQYSYGIAGSAGTCNNTYCHSGVKYKNLSSGIITPQGAKPNPTWGDPGYLGGTGCNTCHGYPPSGTHPQSNTCSACHDHVSQSNLSMEDKTKHLNGVVNTTVDECLGCHSSEGCTPAEEAAGSCFNKELIGAHNTHTDVEMFLAGKKLSTNDYIDATWIYAIKYRKGFPQFACGFCHPMDIGLHKNGVVELDLDPNHALRGSVKTKNKDGGPWFVTRDTLSNVTCNNVYCHSSGFVSEATSQYQFQTTPNWYYSDQHGGTSAFDGVDNCAQCHGNSPNTRSKAFNNFTTLKEGSSAHARHVVGNHYKDVFDGYSGKLAPAGAPGSGSVHGDPKTATNFNCNLCHYNTVRDAFNDLGSTCSGCHTTANNKGILRVYSSGATHVNGNVDVAFIEPFTIRSKAQLRNNISSVQSVYTSWTRFKGYKNITSYDLTRSTPKYIGGSCTTTACHNGTLMEWRTKGPLACAACHVGLPQ